jgi:Predicted membrane protein (DUF2142)
MSRSLPNIEARRTRAPARALARGRDPRALACLLLGLAVLAIALGTALLHASQPRAGTNGVWPRAAVATLSTGESVCQGHELLPAGATAIRLAVQPLQSVGPGLFVTLRRHGRTLQRTSILLGARSSTTASLRPVAHDLGDVTVCLSVGAPAGRVALGGGPTPPGVGSLTGQGAPAGVSVPFTYLQPPAGSWLDRASAIADRLALGRGDWGGRWVAWVTAALLLASLALVVRVLVRTVVADDRTAGGRRLPPLAGTVAAVAVVNALAWSLITPAFQVPDEQTHVAYAQQIAETGRPPVMRRGDERLAPELVAAMRDTRFGFVSADLDARTLASAVWSPLQQQRLDRDLHASLPRRGNGTAGPAAPEPPLYYALEAIPYRIASGATLLDRIALMRMVSALLAGVTALFALLFLREALPGRPWAWSIGGLAVALTPVLGFVSGGVNPDALLFPLCAALFYTFAVAFRRGLTTRRAVWIGALIGVGAVAKINFYGLVPGALLALGLVARASAGGVNRRSLRLYAIAVGVALAPYLLLTALDVLLWDRTFILARTPAEMPEDHGGLGGQLSYLWQLFLPRLPGQVPVFHGTIPAYDLLFKGFVGRFGWLVVSFSPWAYTFASALGCGVLLLAARTCVRQREALRRRWPELLSYAAMAAGLLLLIALVALRGFAPGLPGALQGRYLLPLLALFGAVLALAVRGAGERWGRAAGVALVLVCVGWSVFGQLLTISFFYG